MANVKDRQLVSSDQLGSWITVWVRKFEGCRDFKFDGVVALPQPSPDGCNWAALETPPSIWQPAFDEAVALARLKFNLCGKSFGGRLELADQPDDRPGG